MAKFNFDDLAKKTNLFQEGINNEKTIKEKPIEKKELKKSKNLEKGKKELSTGSINFEIFTYRNDIVKVKSNNLINVSDISKEIIEYVSKALNVGKKEFVDALIIDFFKKNKLEIEKEVQKQIKTNKINL